MCSEPGWGSWARASGMNRKPCLSGIFLVVEMLALLAREKVTGRTRQEKLTRKGCGCISCSDWEWREWAPNFREKSKQTDLKFSRAGPPHVAGMSSEGDGAQLAKGVDSEDGLVSTKLFWGKGRMLVEFECNIVWLSFLFCFIFVFALGELRVVLLLWEDHTWSQLFVRDCTCSEIAEIEFLSHRF